MGINVFGRIPVSCVVLLLMVALVTGCETGDSFSSTSESRGGRGLAGGGSSGGSVPHFSSIAAISFLSREEVEAAQEVRAQEINGQEGGGQLRQLVYVGTSDGRPLNYRAEELSGGLPVFYTPVANPGQSNLGPVWDRQGQVQLPLGPRPVEYTWTLPPDPSGKPILLFFNQRETASALGNFTALPEDYHVVEGNTVVLRLEPLEGGWRASINGEVLPESATSRISGYLGPPAFYSRRHGEHSVTTQALDPDDSFIPGGEGGVKTIRYFQKGLTLTEPLPEPNEENPREPLRIENTIAWSDNSALTDEEISWSVGASDKTYFGEGTDIAVVWDPLRQTFNEILNRAPTDEELEEIEVTKFEELDMSVTARTRVYEEKEASNLPSLEYVLRQNFGALGAAELVIVGAKVLPEDQELFTEENPEAMLMADVVLVGPAPEDFKITWVVAIKTPDPEKDPIVIETGTGFQVDAVWDGTLNGEPVPNPLEHEFVITAKACPDDGAVASRAIRGQEAEDCGDLEVEGRVSLVSTGSDILQVEVSPKEVLPSRMYSQYAPLNEVDVTVKLLRMPEGRTTFPVTLTVEVVDDLEDPTPNPNNPDPPVILLPPNLPVNLRAQGGHAHNHESRPKETFVKDNHVFDSPGVFRTKLKITEVGSLLRVKATPSDEIIVNGSVIPPATTTLDVKVPNLSRLLPRTINSEEFGYVLTGGAGIDNQLTDYPDVTAHPSDHWGTPTMLSNLEQVSLEYQAKRLQVLRQANPDPDAEIEITTHEKVIINDISLPRGGVFDVGETSWSSPHAEHRDGTVADVRTERAGQDSLLIELWDDKTGHYPETEGDHIHVRITGGYTQ